MLFSAKKKKNKKLRPTDLPPAERHRSSISIQPSEMGAACLKEGSVDFCLLNPLPSLSIMGWTDRHFYLSCLVKAALFLRRKLRLADPAARGCPSVLLPLRHRALSG